MGVIFSKWANYFRRLFRKEKPASRHPHLHHVLTTPFDSAFAPLTSTPAHFLSSVDSFSFFKNLIPEKESLISPISSDSSIVFTFNSEEITKQSPARVRSPGDNCRRRHLSNKLKLDPLPRPQKRLRV